MKEYECLLVIEESTIIINTKLAQILKQLSTQMLHFRSQAISLHEIPIHIRGKSKLRRVPYGTLFRVLIDFEIKTHKGHARVCSLIEPIPLGEKMLLNSPCNFLGPDELTRILDASRN